MINTRKSAKYPHIEWLDLENNGVLTESAIVKRDVHDNIYFIRLGSLDNVDKTRILDIVTNKNAEHFEMWDLMSNVTLGNGINALVYFHQLVEVVAPSGHISKPTPGRIGVNMNAQGAPQVAPKTEEGADNTGDAE